MGPDLRKSVFVIASSLHGTMIVNRNDVLTDSKGSIGVGHDILECGHYQFGEVECCIGILELRRRYFGDGVMAIDGGANLGSHTVEWARAMGTYGQVLAFEPQERTYYALAGNVAINNCFNAKVIQAGLGAVSGVKEIPVLDYSQQSNFGGLSLTKDNSKIGQAITEVAQTQMIAIDDLNLDRLDLLKLDIEGMELEALEGAEKTLQACRPVLHVENIQVDQDELATYVKSLDYEDGFVFGMNTIFVHRLDKTLDHIRELHRSIVRAQVQAVA